MKTTYYLVLDIEMEAFIYHENEQHHIMEDKNGYLYLYKKKSKVMDYVEKVAEWTVDYN